ncbi:hypothetical protein HKD37_18G050617 [Glycine soja]
MEEKNTLYGALTEPVLEVEPNMESMKEHMATMMEAMMSVKKIMEANAVATAATSTVAKVNPMPPSGLNQMNHPTSAMVGKDLGSTGGPHYAQSQNKHAFPPHGFPPNCTPPNVAYTPSENVNNSTPILIESQQPQTDHAHISQPMEYAQRWRDLAAQVAPPMMEREMIIVMYSTMKMVGYTPSSFADMVFAGKRIEVGLKRGKFDHPALIKIGANEEDENEGETHVVAAIPIWPSFPPTQQCHYSTNNNPSPYPPPRFTEIPVSYADLLPYPLDNAMVAITPAKVHRPPFFREYDSNAMCACHGEAPGRSIEHCRALKRKVQGLIDAGWLKFEENRGQPFPCVQESSTTRDPRFPTSRVQSFWMTDPLDESISCFLIKVDPCVLVPITFRGLYVLAIRGLHILACRGLHALAFRGLRVLIFIVLHIHTLGEYKFLGHPLILEGDQLCEHIQRGRLSCIYYAYRGKISPVPLQKTSVDHAHQHDHSYMDMDDQHSAQRPQCQSPPADVSVGIAPTRRSVDPKKSNRALGFPALVTGLCSPTGCLFPPARSRHHDIGSRLQDTQWTRRSPTGSWSCQALITGLCQFYGMPVTSSKVIKPPTNRVFIKKYCVPRQAQGETPQQPGDGRQRATDAPPSPLEFTLAHPQKG